jgi:hypothetical protein
MSDQDATPSPALGVEIPEHLRRLLYTAAVRRVEEATDTAFVPDMVDAVRDAIHVLDAFERSEMPPETIVDLAKRAIDGQAPSQMPHSLAEWEALLERLDPVRELVVLIERLTA